MMKLLKIKYIFHVEIQNLPTNNFKMYLIIYKYIWTDSYVSLKIVNLTFLHVENFL